MFFIKDVDSHFTISLFGAIIRIKHKVWNEKKLQRKVVSTGINEISRKPRIIASLTTFPDRICLVHNTISCLLTQTVKPDKLILWLAESQFPKKEEELPESLLKLREFGLTIAWCEDLRSYKKLVPTLKEYPNDIIITFDDDIYYDNDVIEKLYSNYIKDPNIIYTHRGSRIFCDGEKYKVWKFKKILNKWKTLRNPSLCNTIVGCGGVLYPPHALNNDIFNIDLIKTLIPTQDDIYFWAMAALNGTKVQICEGYEKNFITIEGTQEYGLCKINNTKGAVGIGPSEALERVLEYYPQLIDIIKEDL